MLLQPHLARTATAPTALSHLPPEIEHAPTSQAVATDVVLVEGALGAKVRVVQSVREGTQGREEVFERARLPGGDRRGAEPVPASSLRSHQHHGGLDLRAAIDKDEGLPSQICNRVARQDLLQQHHIALLINWRHVEPMVNLAGKLFAPARKRFVAVSGRHRCGDAAADHRAPSQKAERPPAAACQRPHPTCAGLIAPTVCESSN